MSINPWIRSSRPLSVAHRGHSIAYPENTQIAYRQAQIAYRQAIEMGVEMIECDVNLTSDGQLVMIHDATLDRTTDGHGRVNAATWDEVRRLDAGRKFNPAFAGERIPLTEETLLLFKEAGIYACFEVKGGDPDVSKRRPRRVEAHRDRAAGSVHQARHARESVHERL